MRKKIEKNFWDMEIIGNRRKNTYFYFPGRESYSPPPILLKYSGVQNKRTGPKKRMG